MAGAKSLPLPIASFGALLFLGASLHSPASLAADSNRFSMSGNGTLSIEQQTQTSDRWQIKASLSPAAAPVMQVEGRFALSGVLSASSLVCYNDTIFRDGFDGTGL